MTRRGMGGSGIGGGSGFDRGEGGVGSRVSLFFVSRLFIFANRFCAPGDVGGDSGIAVRTAC